MFMKLRNFLTHSNQTLANFSETVGVSEVSMGRYAAGKRVPKPAILSRIVEASSGAVTANDFFPATAAPMASVTDDGPVDMFICDICGIPRGKRLNGGAIDKLFGPGVTMPGSVFAVDITGSNVDPSGIGMADGDPDGYCKPVPGTLVPVPWAPRPARQVLASMFEADGRPYWLDPRQVLAKVAGRFGELGLKPVMAHELEFYLLDAEADDHGRPQPARSQISGRRPTLGATQVYGMDEVDDAADVIDAAVAACRVQSIPADVAIAEYSPGQYEINLEHQSDPLAAADHGLLLKRAIKGTARSLGYDATFMARPFEGISGNGLHLHISLLDDDGNNIFDDSRPGGDERLRHAIGGLQAMMAESMLIFAPNANSYRRFEPHGYAPMMTTWGYNNRSVALRVPAGEGKARRIEHRNAGADANPHLVAAVVLAGIHHGLTNRLDPGAPMEGNANEQATPNLPIHWLDALRAFDNAKVLPTYLAADYCHVYSACKWQEFTAFQARITPADYELYMRAL
jgi:glutamine synthetase